MATRRTYRPKKFQTGGAVIEESTEVLPPENPPETLPTPPPAHADGGQVAIPEADDAVARMLAATKHAEDLQRQARQPQTVEDHIASLPISDHKKSFLRQNTMLLHPEIVPIAARAYQQAKSDGVEDDSPAMNQRLLEGVQREIEGWRQRMVASAHDAAAAVPAMPAPSIERAAEQLSQEAEALRLTASAENTTPITVSAELPPAERAPTRKSLPISAPVSRDIPSSSGKRMSEERTITLSAAEREVARNSFTDPNMTNEERERLYATNKMRMLKARADGWDV
jgi:hypothetical protein